MKTQILFAVLAALMLCVNGAAVQSLPDAESAQIPEPKPEAEAISAETFNFIAGIISQQDRILYRGYYSKPGIASIVQGDIFRYFSVDSRVKISYISALAVGSTSCAYAQILQGGISYSFVTMLLRSNPGYGYQFFIEIWGR